MMLVMYLLTLLLAAWGTPNADVDGNGNTGFSDLTIMLNAWGPCDPCAEDLDGNGAVDFEDLLQVLAAWGPC